MSVERCRPFGVALAAVAGVLCGASPAGAQPECCTAAYMEFVLDEPVHSCLDDHVPVSGAMRFWCCDGELTQTTSNIIWSCAPPWVPDPTTYLTLPPGWISNECPADYQSTCSPADGPIQCDGTEPWQDREIDQGCGEDEHGCEQRDQDGYPMRLSSGIVTIQPIVVFDATPDGIADGNFKYELRWGSHHGRNRAFGTPPDIQYERQDTHFPGDGFLDNFSDRILARGDQRVWVSSAGIITFSPVDATTYISNGERFRLIDLGGNPRYRVESLSTTGPKRRWDFTLFQYDSDPLHRFWSLASYRVGAYGWDVQRLGDHRITKVVDTLGRELRFGHVLSGSSYVVSTLGYATSASESATTVGSFSHLGGARLARVDVDSTYYRFLYGPNPNLITEVVTPARPFSAYPPLNQSTRGSKEIVREGHEFVQLANGGYRARRTYGPSRHWYYAFGPLSTTQLDLNMPELASGQHVACNAGACSSGNACYPVADGGDDKCYLARVVTHDPVTRRTTQEVDPVLGTTTYGYHPSGAPRWAIGPNGVITTHAYDDSGRLVCVVRNDDDTEAALDPLQPELGCDPPSSGNHMTVRKEYPVPGLARTLFPSTLTPTSNVVWEETHDANGRLTSRSELAYTRDVDGALRQETRTTVYTYDSLGRIIRVDGPLDGPGSHDVTEYEYWDAPGTNGHDRGRLKLVRRFVSASAALVTTYEDYDLLGVPRKVTEPSGSMTLATRVGPLEWHVEVTAPGAGSLLTRIYLNPNGNVHYVIDPDGVCTTFDYKLDGANQLTVPLRIARGDAQCGVSNVDVDGPGEVEIRTYAAGKPAGSWQPVETDRLVSIERRLDGVTRFFVDGFTYDRARRLVSRATLDSPAPWTMTYEHGLPAGIAAPDAPGPGTWMTESGVDDLARPAFVYRHLSGSSRQAYEYEYANGASVLPSQIRRGLDTSTSSTSTFVYDDWGALVEATTPEHGTSRYEYDKAARQIKERVGVGTAQVRTSLTTYDMVGRVLAVDHDLEHPVACGSAPDGTPISDLEFRYDTCAGGDTPAGITCAHAAGRVTMARAIVQCASGSAVKRSRWYSYDPLGRPSRVWRSTQSGSNASTIADDYAWTPGSRLLLQVPAYTGGFGTEYSYSETGEIASVAERIVGGSKTDFASDFEYEPFGPLSGFDLAVTIPQPYGTAALSMRRTHREDYVLDRLEWVATPSSGFDPTVAFLDQSFSYSPAGLLTSRVDAASTFDSRHYEYDALMRLTCEARGDGSGQPSAADCVPSSKRLAGLYSYNDGAGSTTPPDTRATSHVPSYAAGANTYQYAGGAGAILSLARAGSAQILGHDALGRRTHDHVQKKGPSGRRNYTYLPDGRVGSISDEDATFQLSIRYDVYGRPELLLHEAGAATTTYELAYDDGGRLVRAVVTEGASDPVEWYYHHAGSQIIGATRVIRPLWLLPPLVKRFWFVTDERGLITRALDQQGVEYYRARWDATGIRTVELEAPDLWFPFAFPGQLIAPGTDIEDDVGTRPALVLNNARVYDPLLGAYLQPDPADPYVRTPEGYAYARNNPLHWIDPTGMRSEYVEGFLHPLSDRLGSGFWIEDNCLPDQAARLAVAISVALVEVASCDYCQVWPVLRDQWVNAVVKGAYHCYPRVQSDLMMPFERGSVALATSRPGKVFGKRRARQTWVSPLAIGASVFDDGFECLVAGIAHEAAHEAAAGLKARDVGIDNAGSVQWYLTLLAMDTQVPRRALEEEWVRNLVKRCFGRCQDPEAYYKGFKPLQ